MSLDVHHGSPPMNRWHCQVVNVDIDETVSRESLRCSLLRFILKPCKMGNMRDAACSILQIYVCIIWVNLYQLYSLGLLFMCHYVSSLMVHSAAQFHGVTRQTPETSLGRYAKHTPTIPHITHHGNPISDSYFPLPVP